MSIVDREVLEREMAVTDFVRLRSELKEILLEVNGARAPVSHSWRCQRQYESSFSELTQLAPKAVILCEITRNDGHLAVQGHSRSPILVPIESPYGLLVSAQY